MTSASRSPTSTPEYGTRAQDVNLQAQFFAAQAVHPQMKALGYGSIINFSSIAWRSGASEMAAYATAKAAVHRPDPRARPAPSAPTTSASTPSSPAR